MILCSRVKELLSGQRRLIPPENSEAEEHEAMRIYHQLVGHQTQLKSSTQKLHEGVV